MSTLKTIGAKIAMATIRTGLAASAAFAGSQSIFLFRDDKGETAAVAVASKTADPTDVNSWGGSEKTEAVLSPSEDGTLHLNRMFIEAIRRVIGLST